MDDEGWMRGACVAPLKKEINILKEFKEKS
jgi:hypothetical protein